MKLLVTMPIFNNPPVTQESVDSVKKDGVDLYFVTNTADILMTSIIEEYPNQINNDNKGCNYAWNEGMKYFLKGDWDWLGLGSSDVVFHKNWYEVLKNINGGKKVYVPNIANSLNELRSLSEPIRVEDYDQQELTGGVAGIFTFMPRKAVEMVYPIPDGFNLWFGDEWIYTVLRRLGWKVVLVKTLFCHHYCSVGVNAVENRDKIIEGERVHWENNAERLINNRIKKVNKSNT